MFSRFLDFILGDFTIFFKRKMIITSILGRGWGRDSNDLDPALDITPSQVTLLTKFQYY